MYGKLKSDKELRAFYGEFTKLVIASFNDPSQKAEELIVKGGFSLRNGYFFHEDKEFIDAKRSLIDRCVVLLGPKFDHESELETIAWDSILEDIKKVDSFEDFVKALSVLYENQFYYIMPNHLFRFEQGVTNVKIGPVEALSAKKIITDLKKITNPKQIVFKEGDKALLEFNSIPITQTVRSLSWRVNISASKQNLEQESLWLINIALSLFRIAYKGHNHSLFPRLGETELLPNQFQSFDRTGFSSTDTGVNIGGGEIPGLYSLDKKAISFTKRTKFVNLAKSIFNPNKKTLAERVSQGLGWLAKGRQSNDKSEKLLFFFTAVEALLSSDDKTAPVVQTIARHTASILSMNIQSREQIASQIRKLYTLRSALVHAGSRGVSKKEVILMQFYSEALFSEVINKADLNMKLSTFQQGLNRASYGGKWPNYN